jgi:hypothetical protein
VRTSILGIIHTTPHVQRSLEHFNVFSLVGQRKLEVFMPSRLLCLDIVHTTRDGALSNNSRRHKQVIRYLQEHTFTHDNRRYLLQKYISLENLDVVLFNDIIFMLYD